MTKGLHQQSCNSLFIFELFYPCPSVAKLSSFFLFL